MNGLAVRLPNWIGDAVMAVPTLRELRRLHPGDSIVLIGPSWVTGLFEEQGLADEIRTLPATTSVPAQIRAEAALAADCETILLLPNSWSTALAALRSGARRRCGYHRHGRGMLLTDRATTRTRERGLHQIFHYLDLLAQTRLSPADYLDGRFHPSIRLEASSAARERSRQVLSEEEAVRPLIGVSPGATYGSAKRWLVNRYARLADRFVKELGATVVLIGSAAEVPLARRIVSEMRAPATVLSGKTDLTQLMGVLSRLDLLVTNDSGPMHLAAALETPQVALFGSTDDVATGPWGGTSAVIHKRVECSPCLLRECPIDLRCFRRIEVEEVFAAGLKLLES